MALTFVKGKQAQDHFETLLAATSLIPFVGAGFSFGPCPGWGQFLDKLYEQIKPSMTPEEIESYNLLKQGTTAADFEALLDLLFTCEGKGKGDRLVQSIFDVDIKHPFKTALEHKFGLFHQAFKGPWITTNLDRFIEKTYPADHTAIYGNDAPRLQSHLTNADSAGLLLKIHGDVKEPSSWVLSKQHYDHAYGCEQGVDLNAPLPKFLARLYTNHTLLFIGCSLQDDRPLKVLEQLMEIHGARQHFALLLEPKITNKKKDKHKKKEHTLFKRRLSNLNITPIWLDSFDDINTVLSQLGPNAEEPKQIAEVKTSVESPNIFVGREKEIKQLTSALKKPGSVHAVSGGGQLLHLTGIGGIGKTTLAREALSRCKDQFSDGCFEIRLAGLSPQSFTMQLAARLQLKIPEPSSAANAQQVISDLLNKYRLLILLDNVLDSKELLAVLPKRCKSSIIVTSRDQDLADTLKIQRSKLKITASNIQAFDADECLSLFYRLLEDNYQTEQEPIYLSIAEQLGFLPIALRLAISTMMFGSRYSATQLLNELESGNKLNLIDEALRHEANSDERSIAAVFDLSAPLLTPEHKKVLAKLAVCAPGGVPLDFLKQLGTTLKASVLTNSLEALVRFSWCKQTNVDDVAHYELHQLVRELIQAQLVDEKLKKLHTDTVHRVFIVKPQHFLKLDRWISQTNSAVLRLKAGKDERLVDWAGGDFWQFCSNRGHVERFVQYCEWVIECFDHKQNWVAMALGHQASALESWEQLDKAMVLYKKEEVIRKTLNDQKGLAGCFCNQASILRLKNQPDEAILLYRKAEVINQKFGNQLWLAICYGNRALTLRKKGLPDEAMALLKKAEVTYKKLQNQSELANCYSNQALILNDKHQLEEAMALFKKAATISDTLGDREGLARCYWSQGSVHNKLGNLQTQKDLWRKSIALIKQHGLPTENEETALAGLDSRFLRFKMKIVAWLRKEVAKKV